MVNIGGAEDVGEHEFAGILLAQSEPVRNSGEEETFEWKAASNEKSSSRALINQKTTVMTTTNTYKQPTNYNTSTTHPQQHFHNNNASTTSTTTHQQQHINNNNIKLVWVSFFFRDDFLVDMFPVVHQRHGQCLVVLVSHYLSRHRRHRLYEPGGGGGGEEKEGSCVRV